MTISEALIRFVVGGSLIVLISYLGKSKQYYLAGLAVLFPIVTIVGYYFLSLTTSRQTLQHIVLMSLYSVPTVIVFLFVLYFSIKKLPLWQSMFLSLLGWLIMAVLVTFLFRLIAKP
ncbi:MAG: hypothetical protein C4570_03885 [Ammonifex sp.]|nr:MAG: hypothetical protein C4570_03885 [Ammonifex sp.]